jgi:hypothetical protein
MHRYLGVASASVSQLEHHSVLHRDRRHVDYTLPSTQAAMEDDRDRSQIAE